jgi:hypothetical protein
MCDLFSCMMNIQHLLTGSSQLYATCRHICGMNGSPENMCQGLLVCVIICLAMQPRKASCGILEQLSNISTSFNGVSSSTAPILQGALVPAMNILMSQVKLPHSVSQELLCAYEGRHSNAKFMAIVEEQCSEYEDDLDALFEFRSVTQ